ncbi:hypothetical protein [Streptomyces sp. NPDC006879]|uniref:hypothetical protein n=1 Tax=Streptomyces sp. NPDC006879 TaxID=3364767 RepID=UPI0036AD8D2B
MALNAHDTPRPRPEAGEQGADTEEQLPCGRWLSQLWDGAADPAHPSECSYCAQALADLRSLDWLVRRARAEDAATVASGGLVGRVMDVVRLELRPGRTLALGSPDGAGWIIEAAAARELRAAADRLPGIRCGSCRIAPMRAQERRGPLSVRIEVAVSMAWTVPAAAESVRRAISVAACEQLGLNVQEVAVHVVDVLCDSNGSHG